MNHLLIVRLGAIGDVVHALPALAALRRADPSLRVSWVVERSAAALLRHARGIDRLVEIDTRTWRRNLLHSEARRSIRDRLRTLRAEPIDVALEMQGLLKSGLVALTSGAPRRIGFATPALREPASRIFLTEQVEVDDTGHVIEKNLALVRHLGIETSGPFEFLIDVPESDLRDVDARLPARDFAILNPGGGWWTKQWPAEAFGQLADLLHEAYGLASVVTFGPGEEALADRVAAASRSRSASPFPSSLIQFVALARRARLFVGGDTGPLHLAAAVGTPIVGIYGPTEPLRNGPFDTRDVAIGRTDLSCRVNCHRRTCSHWECMDIPVSVVQRAVTARLQRL